MEGSYGKCPPFLLASRRGKEYEPAAAEDIFQKEKDKKLGSAGNRTPDLSHPKRESYH